MIIIQIKNKSLRKVEYCREMRKNAITMVLLKGETLMDIGKLPKIDIMYSLEKCVNFPGN